MQFFDVAQSTPVESVLQRRRETDTAFVAQLRTTKGELLAGRGHGEVFLFIIVDVAEGALDLLRGHPQGLQREEEREKREQNHGKLRGKQEDKQGGRAPTGFHPLRVNDFILPGRALSVVEPLLARI